MAEVFDSHPKDPFEEGHRLCHVSGLPHCLEMPYLTKDLPGTRCHQQFPVSEALVLEPGAPAWV